VKIRISADIQKSYRTDDIGGPIYRSVS